MKQTSIVRTLIHDPDLIVLDEPTTGMDVLDNQLLLILLNPSKIQAKL